MKARKSKQRAEWIDPYEFLATIKKEPSLSNLALGNNIIYCKLVIVIIIIIFYSI